MRILNHCSSVCRGVIGGQQNRGMFRPPCSDRRSQRMGSHLRIIKPLLLPRAHHLTPVSCHLCMITQPPSPPSLCPIKQMGSSTWLFLSSLYPLFPPPLPPLPPSRCITLMLYGSVGCCVCSCMWAWNNLLAGILSPTRSSPFCLILHSFILVCFVFFSVCVSRCISYVKNSNLGKMSLDIN